MVEWCMEMMMMMMVSRPKSNLLSTQREYLVRTTTNQSDLASLRYMDLVLQD